VIFLSQVFCCVGVFLASTGGCLVFVCSYTSIHMQTIMKIPFFRDSVLTHLLAGLAAGFFAVCIGSPIDVVSIHFRLLHKSTTRLFGFRLIMCGSAYIYNKFQ